MEATWILAGAILSALVGGLAGAFGATWSLKHEVATLRLQVDDNLDKANRVLGRIRRARGPQDGFAADDAIPNTPLTREEVLRRAYERGMAFRPR